jgi:2-keto-4-pentenoate hydratase/2-oxohepta-3-ene-1,7-dioic acid hydratase in catechol pathway
MKLVRFGAVGAERPGIVDGAGKVRDLSGILADIDGTVLGDLGAIAKVDIETLPVAEDGARLGPCLSGIGKIVCIGRNYAEHAKESGSDVPSEPMIFMKATSALNGPYDDVILPRGGVNGDWEVELAIVIGKKAKYVAESEAQDHIAGYCIMNDVSERDFQRNRQGQFTKGKSCDTFAPLGPWLVTRDEIADAQKLRLWTHVNGEVRQDGTTADMVFGVNFLVSYLSQFMTLHPGDVIATGTPSGVAMGMKPPAWLKAGDVMELGIEGLGTQRNSIGMDS